MKFSWAKIRVKGFAKPIPTAERRNWFWRLTEHLPIFVVIVCIVVTIWIWVKIYQLWAIKSWLESL